jgi:hypothetical protein
VLIPLGEVNDMPKGIEHPPGYKKGEQDTLLARVICLAPLISLILYALELVLKITGVIR